MCSCTYTEMFVSYMIQGQHLVGDMNISFISFYIHTFILVHTDTFFPFYIASFYFILFHFILFFVSTCQFGSHGNKTCLVSRIVLKFINERKLHSSSSFLNNNPVTKWWPPTKELKTFWTLTINYVTQVLRSWKFYGIMLNLFSKQLKL